MPRVGGYASPRPSRAGTASREGADEAEATCRACTRRPFGQVDPGQMSAQSECRHLPSGKYRAMRSGVLASSASRGLGGTSAGIRGETAQRCQCSCRATYRAVEAFAACGLYQDGGRLFWQGFGDAASCLSGQPAAGERLGGGQRLPCSPSPAASVRITLLVQDKNVPELAPTCLAPTSRHPRDHKDQRVCSARLS